MEWYRLDVSIARHPRMLRLASRLDISLLEARGIVMTLFGLARTYHPFDGDLSNELDTLPMMLDWDSSRGDVVTALRDTGWLTPEGSIAQWAEYNGEWLASYERKKTSQRESYSKQNSADLQHSSADLQHSSGILPEEFQQNSADLQQSSGRLTEFCRLQTNNTNKHKYPPLTPPSGGEESTRGWKAYAVPEPPELRRVKDDEIEPIAAVFDALEEACGSGPGSRTEFARGWIPPAIRLLREGKSPDAIRHVGKRYRTEWPSVTISPESIERHWSKFAGAAKPPPEPPPESPTIMPGTPIAIGDTVVVA
jgi:hypothetical protein